MKFLRVFAAFCRFVISLIVNVVPPILAFKFSTRFTFYEKTVVDYDGLYTFSIACIYHFVFITNVIRIQIRNLLFKIFDTINGNYLISAYR